MLVLDYNYDGVVNQKSEVLKNELEKNPSILSVAFSRSVPGSYFPHAGTEIEKSDGEMEMQGQPIFQVGLTSSNILVWSSSQVALIQGNSRLIQHKRWSSMKLQRNSMVIRILQMWLARNSASGEGKGFIACLGLLGLATYTAEKRTKQIGIRKVLGADLRNIVSLLSKDFIVLVLIAIVISTPISWYAMSRWLEGFAYKMEIHAWIFVLSGFIALLISVLTISYQSVKSAAMNPVSSLRSE